MSPTYKCLECGYVWNEEATSYIRCLQCGSKNIKYPKTSHNIIIYYLIVFCVTGVIGAVIGVWLCKRVLHDCDPWLFGLIGFLIGFIGLPIFYCFDEILEII